MRIFGTDGIRGKVGEYPVTVECALKIGRALSVTLSTTKPMRVVVGRDTRISGEMLESAFAAGLNSAGVDVLRTGVVPTPAVAALARQMEAGAAVSISASHNPFEDNGFKFFNGEGRKLSDEEEAAVEEAFHSVEQSAPQRTGAEVGQMSNLESAEDFYVETVLARFPPDFRLEGVTIVVDGSHGAGCRTTPKALSALGANVKLFFAEPNGININESCGSTHPETLSELVRRTGAQLGLAHDGDADRVVFADENGQILDGDEFLAILGNHALKRGELPGAGLVATVLSNFGLDESISKAGGRVIRAAVGDRHVAEEMARNDLFLGGEQSGHFIFRDVSLTGDGLVSALKLLHVMQQTGKALSELRTCMVKFPQVAKNIPVKIKPPLETLSGFPEAIETAKSAIGDKGRILVRYSGTERLCRLLAEGPHQEVLEREIERLANLLIAEIGA
ncbi:MAG: phosphoglucosamine mutase [Verrucomicrobiia bacterium]